MIIVPSRTDVTMRRHPAFLLLLFAPVVYYAASGRDANRPHHVPPSQNQPYLPVLFSVDAAPETAAGLVRGLSQGSNGWCHAPVAAKMAWDFALVDAELNGQKATEVYRLDGAPVWDAVYAPKSGSECHSYVNAACLAGSYRRVKVHHGIRNMKRDCCKACARDPQCRGATLRPAAHECLLSASTAYAPCDRGNYSTLTHNVSRGQHEAFYRETQGRRLTE